MPRNNKHLFIPANNFLRADFKYPRDVRGDTPPYPVRENRIAHARTVLQRLNDIEAECTTEERSEGIYIEFIGEAPVGDQSFDLNVGSLSYKESYQVVSARRDVNGIEHAVVFVPNGKLPLLKNRIEKTTKENPKRDVHLVNSITHLQQAILKSLWTSEETAFPNDLESDFAWEVWIFEGDTVERNFNNYCTENGIRIIGSTLRFVDRSVKQVICSPRKLAGALQHHRIICELRKPSDTALPIYESNIEDQYEWSESLLQNLQTEETNSEIWLLDSGLNRSNPLIGEVVPSENILTINADWGVHDTWQRWKCHGTCMAGVLLYGDLLKKLLSNEPITMTHTLGSVKILPSTENNLPENYPWITERAISLSEIQSPNKQKIYCMAVTDPNQGKLGESTSWSAVIDRISYGAGESGKALFIVSAGNVENLNHDRFPFSYPQENETTPIQDPAQSWNALTIGAYTDRVTIQETNLRNSYHPLATRGSLSPNSTTSLIWTSLSDVPIKPDVVFEGGNIAVSNQGRDYDYPASLCELTTSGLSNKVFDYFHSTSSATAYAANMAAKIQATNNNFWPETIRALIVHSAEWTPSMNREFSPFENKDKVHGLIRKYGFGVPNLDRAIACANNEVTLISQKTLKPYKQGSSNTITYDDCHFYNLPWPVEVLRDLGDTTIRMKVTLSYFIEPNPSRRGDVKKFVYSSYGLRFSMIGPTESNDSFRGRISKVFQRDDIVQSREDTGNWFLGQDLRTRGSIHSDIWKGKAVDLAAKSQLAVFPIGGWWKEYKKKARWENDIRYSLIISIEGPEVATTLYSTVENLVRIPVPVTL